MVPTSAYGTAYSYTQPGLLFFLNFPKRRTPGVCGAMSKMFVGGCWYFLEKCWKTGGKRTRCPRQPIVDMDVDCRRPRHDENYSSLFVENSHPETLHQDMCIACSGSSSVLPIFTNSQFCNLYHQSSRYVYGVQILWKKLVFLLLFILSQIHQNSMDHSAKACSHHCPGNGNSPYFHIVKSVCRKCPYACYDAAQNDQSDIDIFYTLILPRTPGWHHVISHQFINAYVELLW